MAKLVVLPCEDYSKEHVSACVDSIFADFGDAEAFLVKGKNIFIKANLVTDLPPERHGTTHPMLVECIARRLVEAGARVVVGDSSGGAYTRAYMNNIYRVTGMTEACKASGAELNDDFGFSTVDLKGKVNRHQEIIDVFFKSRRGNQRLQAQNARFHGLFLRGKKSVRSYTRTCQSRGAFQISRARRLLRQSD